MKIRIDVEKPEEPPYDDMILIKVTVAQYYCIPCKGEQTAINGWPVEEVMADWFGHRDINSSHRTRDGSHIGGGDIVEKAEIITEEEYRRERKQAADRLKRARAEAAREHARRIPSIYIEYGSGTGPGDSQDE